MSQLASWIHHSRAYLLDPSRAADNKWRVLRTIQPPGIRYLGQHPQLPHRTTGLLRRSVRDQGQIGDRTG